MVKKNVTTISLSGESTVQFDKTYDYFWVSNLGDADVLVSMDSITDNADGVITVPSGCSCSTMHGYGADTLYIKGSGKVQVMGTYSAFNPFKRSEKGGEIGKASGNVVTIKGAGFPLLSLKAYGRSWQITEPSVETPADISSIGDSGSLTVTTYGKNLFDFEAWKNDVNKVNNGTFELFDNGLGITSADSLASSSECYTISKTFLYYGSGPIKTNSSETYTLSWSVSGDVSNGRVRIFSNGVSPSLAYSNSSSRKCTFTTPSDCEFITIRLEVSAAASTVVFSDIQLEKGETATDYEPFQSISAEITTGLPMRGIPVSDGGNYTDSNGQEWICDSIEYDYTTAVKHQRIAVINSYNGETVRDNYISTTGGLDTGATIIYPAKTVTETTLTADEINALRGLVTFDGVTNVYNSDNADMAVEYLTSKAVSKAVMPIITALRSDVNA